MSENDDRTGPVPLSATPAAEAPGTVQGDPRSDMAEAAEVGVDATDAEDAVDPSRHRFTGEGRRWYDFPYKLAMWLLTSWRRKLLPVRVRRRLNRGMNFLIPFNEVEWLRRHPQHRSYADASPGEEEVILGSTWVIDIFPPSRTQDLLRGLQRGGWDTDRVYSGLEPAPNSEMVVKSRSGWGWRWWRLGEVARKESTYLFSDATREALPDGIEYVELRAVQLGSSITAVIARFSRTADGELALNRTWHREHPPQLVWRGLRRAAVDDTYFATIRNTRAERQRQHDVARRWLAARLPGYFAADLVQPVVDLCLFEHQNPLADEGLHAIRDGLRALGLEGYPGLRLASPEVPHVALVPHEQGHGGQADGTLGECWALVANRELANRALEEHRAGYGGSRDAEFHSRQVDEFVQELMLMLAVDEYERASARRLASLRDTAQQHGHFSVRRLKRLRSDLLARSLELTWVARDTKRLWTTGVLGYRPITIDATPTWGTPGGERSFDYTKRVKKRLSDGFRTLIQEDARYRETLATAASLGAAVEATKLGRRALAVAVLSLIVVIATLLFMEPGGGSLWHVAVEWIRQRLSGR